MSTTTDEVTGGDGTCSLREAVLYADGTAEGDCSSAPLSGTTTVTLPSGLYALTGGVLSLTHDTVIRGAGAASTTINAGGLSEVLAVGSAAHVTISGVTVTGGATGLAPCIELCTLLPKFGAPGGGIDNAGTLALESVIVSGNRTGSGATNPFCTIVNSGCPAGDGGDGGGIENSGTMTVNDSTISDNVTGSGGSGTDGGDGGSGADGVRGGASGAGGSGGGIDNNGTLTVSNSTISGNVTGGGSNGTKGGNGGSGATRGGDGGPSGAGGSGAGIENSGSLTVTRSSFIGNRTGIGGNGGQGGNGGSNGGNGSTGSSGGSGAAIDSSTNLSVSNSTITGNTTAAGGALGTGGAPGGGIGGGGQPGNGGGIHQTAMGATVGHATIVANSATGTGGGVSGDGGSISIANSIVASNTASASASTRNCGGSAADQGGNIEFGGTSCPGFLVADPQLGALADNGGPTQTMALHPGSPAVHHVATCVAPVDERGVARPVGSACDSGAYELAAPTISAAGAAAGSTTSATVTAAINPNFKPTTVTVRYGTTTAYGSSLPAQSLAAVNNALPFSAGLAGLRPSTTYHAEIVAVNADGTSSSADIAFATPAPLATSISAASTTGTVLALTINCSHGSAGSICKGPITLSTHETTQGSGPVAVASALDQKRRGRSGHGHKPKGKTVRVTVAKGRFSVATGHKKTFRLSLNKAGQALLAHFYRLPTTLSVAGTTRLSRTVTFSYRRLHLSPAYQWAFSNTFAFATQLTLSGLPRKSHVTVVCDGGGCPFARKSFSAPKHGKLQLAPALGQRHLRVGTTLDLEITAANTVGEVVRFTVLAGKLPKESFLCMPPGARTPSACTA